MVGEEAQACPAQSSHARCWGAFPAPQMRSTLNLRQIAHACLRLPPRQVLSSGMAKLTTLIYTPSICKPASCICTLLWCKTNKSRATPTGSANHVCVFCGCHHARPMMHRRAPPMHVIRL